MSNQFGAFQHFTPELHLFFFSKSKMTRVSSLNMGLHPFYACVFVLCFF